MPLLRKKVKEMLGGYLQTKELSDLDSYIVFPSLNDDQGILGALKLGIDARKEADITLKSGIQNYGDEK